MGKITAASFSKRSQLEKQTEEAHSRPERIFEWQLYGVKNHKIHNDKIKY